MGGGDLLVSKTDANERASNRWDPEPGKGIQTPMCGVLDASLGTSLLTLIYPCSPCPQFPPSFVSSSSFVSFLKNKKQKTPSSL